MKPFPLTYQLSSMAIGGYTVVCRTIILHQAGIGGGPEVFVAENVSIALLFLATSYPRASALLST